MKALGILAAVLLILFLAGQLRLGVRAEYSAQGLNAWARLGMIQFPVFPPKQKDKPAAAKKPKKKPADKQEQTALEKVGGALDYAKALLPVVLEAAGQFKRKLRMDTLTLELTAGGTDPADAAMVYGQASAVLGAFWYPLTQAFHVKDGRAHVTVDFDAPSVTLYAAASLSLKLGQILRLGLYFGMKALRAFLTVRREQRRKVTERKAA